MQLSTSDQREAPEPGRRTEVESLLVRYPDVSVGEAAEILRFIKEGPPVEVALMSSDDRLRAQVQRFKSDHASEFRLGRRDWVTLAILIVGLLILCALVWDAGAG